MSPKMAPESIRPSGIWRKETISKMAGAARPPRTSSPPIQTAIARTVANRNTSILIIIIERTIVDTVRWQPWSSDAFARARDEDRPVLLSIAATWCESCLEMDRTTYADSQVAGIVNDAFVAIRVDADRRPDIS